MRKLFSLLFALLFVAVFSVVRLFPRAAFSYALPARGEGEMRLHFLDVGQGDCTVVEFPDGSAMVVDAGNGSRENDELLTRYLRGLHIQSPLLVFTHADADHCGGFPAIIRTFGAEKLFLPVLSSADSSYRNTVEAAIAAGVPTEILTRYGGGEHAGASWSCISPRSAEEEDANDSSAVLYLSYAGVGALLCGDISGTREKFLLTEYSLFAGIYDSGGRTVRLEDTKILKVAHHGSGTSSTGEWLSLLGAETAIVSCGRGNSYGHPALEATERLAASGARIFRTDELGCVMVTVSQDGTYRTEWNYFERA